jgi:hypothetical protein
MNVAKAFIVTSFLTVASLSAGFSQMRLESALFAFDRKVDNTFVNKYTTKYTSYFERFYAIDARRDRAANMVYGCATERSYDYIYYFDEKKKNQIFGYDSDTGKTFINSIGKVAVTGTGRIFAVDTVTGLIHFIPRSRLRLLSFKTQVVISKK